MIENQMVNDKHWKHHENEAKVFGECAGCKEDIYGGHDIYEFEIDGEKLLVHQDSECCQQLIGDISYCKVAGED